MSDERGVVRDVVVRWKDGDRSPRRHRDEAEQTVENGGGCAPTFPVEHPPPGRGGGPGGGRENVLRRDDHRRGGGRPQPPPSAPPGPLPTGPPAPRRPQTAVPL